ncbi:helix-turn-helix domain-containing protein [Pseudaestuariivita rosea]|uniref:helix-turn-helix domain-containing protein n=1 Tax=Pseudaestuariivita rosea TaxID=2763263 RepID=UPI003AF50100
MTDAYTKLKRDLHKAGISLRSISRDVGVSHTAVTDVARGARRSRRIKLIIAERLGTVPSSIWPERYQNMEGML